MSQDNSHSPNTIHWREVKSRYFLKALCLLFSKSLKWDPLVHGGGGEVQAILMCRDMSQDNSHSPNIVHWREVKSIYFLKALCLLFPKSLKWDP